MLNVIFASRCSFVRQPHPRPLQRSTGMLVLLKGMLTVLTFGHTQLTLALGSHCLRCQNCTHGLCYFHTLHGMNTRAPG